MKTELYKHYDAEGALLYIGIAKNSADRLKQHSGSKWKKSIAKTEITIFPTRQDAMNAEAEAIRKEHPKFNKTHLPIEQRRQQDGQMSAEEFREGLEKIGLTQGQAAKFFGVNIRSINGYANGRLVPKHVSILLRLMIRLKLKPEDV